VEKDMVRREFFVTGGGAYGIIVVSLTSAVESSISIKKGIILHMPCLPATRKRPMAAGTLAAATTKAPGPALPAK
jgi:hypothetical protein